MSLGSKSGCPQPNNEKKSINPCVSNSDNILVSECCGAEMLYTVSDRYGFNMWSFCPQCLDSCNTLEVNVDFDSDKYMELLENDNENQLNKIKYADENMACPYCEEIENIDIAENVEQFEDSIIWACHECCKFWEVDEKGNIHKEVE